LPLVAIALAFQSGPVAGRFSTSPAPRGSTPMTHRLQSLARICIARGRTIAAGVAGLLREEPLPQRPLVLVAGGLVAGAIVARSLSAAPSPALPCWLAGLVAVAGWHWASARGRPRLATVALVAAALAAGAAWSAARFDLFSGADLAWELDDAPRPVAIRGRVVAAPQLLGPPGGMGRAAAIGPASEFVLAVTAMRDRERWRPATGRAKVVVRGEPAPLSAGTEVRIFGRGLRPAAPLNPGEFDRAAQARADRCLSLVRVTAWDCVVPLARPSPWSPAAALDRLRTAAAATLAAGITPARAPLAEALILGGRGGLPRDVADDFAATGTIHVLSISGLHLSLLAAGLFAVLRSVLVPRGWSLVAVAIVTGLYAALAGGETPVVRAMLMVWVACVAAAASRRGSTINALAAAAIVIVAWRPAEAASAGAQLSFLSTAVLVGVAPLVARPPETDPIARLVDRSRSRWEKAFRGGGRAVATAFLTGLAVSLATAPLVAARFHVVSPVGLVANVVIAPLVPLAMACGLLCLAAAVVAPPLAAVFAAGCDAALAMLEMIVAAAAAVPAGHAWVAGPAWWWVLGWYAIFGAAVIWGRRDLVRRPAAWATLAAGWSGVGLAAAALGAAVAPLPGGLRVVMAAVGHGCGIVVRSPHGRCLLYDAGRLGAPAAASRSLAAVLWSERVTRIDTLVISHADADHFNAVPELLGRFRVGEILVSEAFLANRSPTVAELLADAEARGIPVRPTWAGRSFAIDPLCRVRVLHPAAAGDDPPADQHLPPSGQSSDDDNATSVVLSVESAGRRLLLTGDLEGPALAAFARALPGACDVLVAPHHGSVTSLPADIARVTSPSVVLVSGRGGRAWPEVHAAYAAAAGAEPATVLKTGRDGAVAITLTAGSVRAEQFAAGRWRAVEMPTAQAVVSLGRVRSQPPASSRSWLTTYAASSKSTPLVNP
jgi:competence protein ComEC